MSDSDTIGSQDAFGTALLEQLANTEPVHYFVERDDGLIEERDAQSYFQDPSEWPEQELEVMKKAKSPILDVGCGAGRHVLHLQEKQYRVTGMDVSQGAIDVCKKRGVKQAVVRSLDDMQAFATKFRTVLLLGGNLGLGGSYEGTLEMLKKLYRVTAPNALIIGSFTSPLPTDNPAHLEYHERNKKLGLQIGQTKIRIRYKNLKSDWMPFYLTVPTEFVAIGREAGWHVRTDLAHGNTHFVVMDKV